MTTISNDMVHRKLLDYIRVTSKQMLQSNIAEILLAYYY